MNVALGLVLLLAILIITGIVSAHVKHPENSELDGGTDRPAGPDAEDPPTATPNRFGDPPVP